MSSLQVHRERYYVRDLRIFIGCRLPKEAVLKQGTVCQMFTVLKPSCHTALKLEVSWMMALTWQELPQSVQDPLHLPTLK